MFKPSNACIFKGAGVFILTLALALSMTSCSKKGPEIANPQGITIASLADAKRLLPPLATDTASSAISGLLFNGLVKYDPQIKLVGDLAESWDVNNAGLEIVFHLRKGVKWHDGKEFTSADVLFTYQTVTDPKVPTPYGANYGPVDKVEAVDPYTIRVTYKEPYAPALESWSMGIMPMHILEGKDISLEEPNRKPLGLGPYKLKEWVTGQKIVLEANPDYFEGKPTIDTYVSRVIPDDATMFLELKQGGVDYMNLTPVQFKMQTDTEDFKRYFQKFQYPAFVYTYMGYNHLDLRFADKRVRRALTHAINKQDIIEGVLMGYGTACTGPFPPESWAYNPNAKDPEYSPEKAKALLKEAGWTPGPDGIMTKDGKPFAFTVITNQGNDVRMKAAQIIKEHLKAVGVRMDIKVLEWQAMLHDFVDKKQFEAVLMGWSLSRDPDAYDIWHSSKTKETEFNFISYKNEELDKLLIEGRRTFDMEKRRQIYHRIHEIMADEQPYTFLFVPDSLPILHKRFKGVKKAPIGIFYDFYYWQVPKDRAQWY